MSFAHLKLGKLDKKDDARTLQFTKYKTALLPKPPASRQWGIHVQHFPMYLNDQLGDCTVAAAAHLEQVWTSWSARPWTPNDQQVLQMYWGTGDQDDGRYLLDVLNYWRNHGLSTQKISLYAEIDPKATTEVKQAVNLFGGIYIGLQLPVEAQDMAPWKVVPGMQPGSWGGHCLAPETKVLTDDLRWIAIGDLKIGDGLLGFDEHPTISNRRWWKRSLVEQAPILRLPCYDLTFEDGTTVRASADHQWLVGGAGSTQWLRTSQLREGPNRFSRIIKPLSVWDTDVTRDGGYLAAAFDGEGCVVQHNGNGRPPSLHRVDFYQSDNEMLVAVGVALESAGYAPAAKTGTPGVTGSRPKVLSIQGRANTLRFLGSVRPQRLLPKFDPDRTGMFFGQGIAVVEKQFVGEQEVVGLQTSTRTYVAEGFASHNCVNITAYTSSYLTCVTWGQRLRMSWGFFRACCDEGYAVLSHDFSPGLPGYDFATLQTDLQQIGNP